MGQNNQRKFYNIILDRDLQIRMMASSIIYMILIAIITTAIVLYPLINNMSFSHDSEAQYVAAQSFLVISRRIVPGLIVLFLIFTIYQLIITHRICGPLVSITNIFRRISEGDLSGKLQIRKNDYLKEECVHINEMISGLSQIVERINSDYSNLKEKLENISITVTDPAEKEKIAHALAAIKHEAEYVGKSLSLFKVSKGI